MLGREAARSETAATLVRDVLGRHAATVSVEEKARAVEILADIARRYPNVETPLQRVDIPAYVRKAR
jgi:hypothetical protein